MYLIGIIFKKILNYPVGTYRILQVFVFNLIYRSKKLIYLSTTHIQYYHLPLELKV